jgi:hypothetical protein
MIIKIITGSRAADEQRRKLKVKRQLSRDRLPRKGHLNGIKDLPYSGLAYFQMNSRVEAKLFSGFKRHLKLLVALQNLQVLRCI